MRRPIIAGNWKMNKNQAEARELINELLPLVKDAEAEVSRTWLRSTPSRPRG